MLAAEDQRPRAWDALVLEHLPLADAIASTSALRLFPLVEGEH